jgi:hypothetical protein
VIIFGVHRSRMVLGDSAEQEHEAITKTLTSLQQQELQVVPPTTPQQRPTRTLARTPSKKGIPKTPSKTPAKTPNKPPQTAATSYDSPDGMLQNHHKCTTIMQ